MASTMVASEKQAESPESEMRLLLQIKGEIF